MAKLTKAQIAAIEAAKEEMRTWLKPGITLYTQLDHVSRSGMMRHISVKVVEEGEIRDITWHVANVLNEKRTKEGSIKVCGCGMDMGFGVVYNLGRALYPHGFECIGEKPLRCPSMIISMVTGITLLIIITMVDMHLSRGGYNENNHLNL